MIQLTIQIGDEANASLEAQARAEGRTVSELAGEMVEEAVRNQGYLADPFPVTDIRWLTASSPQDHPTPECTEWTNTEWSADPFLRLGSIIEEVEVTENAPIGLAERDDQYSYHPE